MAEYIRTVLFPFFQVFLDFFPAVAHGFYGCFNLFTGYAHLFFQVGKLIIFAAGYLASVAAVSFVFII